MVPRFPRPELRVALSGVCEIPGASGLLVAPFARWAAIGLALLLLALFPAKCSRGTGGDNHRRQAGHAIGCAKFDIRHFFMATIAVAIGSSG